MSGTKGKVCRLKEALYGLKQSPRVWFRRFRAAMITNEYKQCHRNHTLFVKRMDRKVAALILCVCG